MDPKTNQIHPDKGNATVILNKDDYDTKILDLLSDKAYIAIPENPTRKLEAEVQTKLSSLVKLKRITKKIYNQISPKLSRPPIFYGLPKIHKTTIPLRPICDFRKSPSYKLANHLNKILKILTIKSRLTLKNSYQFAKQIKDYQLQPNQIMASFDVTSLFTKVPIAETMNYLNVLLTKEPQTWKEHTSLAIKDILDLTQQCLSSNYFKWNDSYFKQSSGTPMGSPIFSVFAEIYMQYFESEVVLNHPKVHFYRRFVDDTFAVIEKGSTL
jgi:hypothetical protein